MIWSLFSKKTPEKQKILPDVAFSPSLPDITKSQPERVFQSSETIAFFVRDIKSIGETAGLPSLFDYPNVLAVVNRETGRPVFIVAYEISAMGTRALCAFTPAGHVNYGSRDDMLDPGAFVEKSLHIVERELGIRLTETARK